MASAANPKPTRPLLVVFAIVVTAAALTASAALGPVRLNDSFWIDWVWLDQFARELGNGVLYPRWLPLSHDGLGSPVFYYYPPLAFYAASAFVLAGLGVYAALLATFFAGYIVAGAGMYLWLKDQAGKPMVGALVYTLAPYHACNFYLRGALAEFVATAILPFAMFGLRRLLQGKGYGFAISALSYAALIATHLPLALLASLFLIAPYVLIQSWRTPRRLLYAGAALATGVALAGAYLVPALMLEPYRDAAKLWEHPLLQPQNWTFWNSPVSKAYVAMLAIGGALAVPLASFVLIERSRWAIVGLIYVLLGIGLVPAFWSLPLIQSVQFPFRILPLAEFALATAVSFARLGPALASLALFPVLLTTFASASPGSEGVTMAALKRLHPDVPENLPPGERPYGWPSRWALDIAKEHDRPTYGNGITVEPVFYFPAWQVRCDGRTVRTFPNARTQLLSYEGRGCTRTLELTDPEKIGMAISLLALIGLNAPQAVRRLHNRSLGRGGTDKTDKEVAACDQWLQKTRG